MSKMQSSWRIHQSCVFWVSTDSSGLCTFKNSFESRHFFPPNHFLQTWIIYFGESLQKWKIINLHGFYGTYGKEETIKFSVIWILILETFSNCINGVDPLGWGTYFPYTWDRSNALTGRSNSSDYPR